MSIVGVGALKWDITCPFSEVLFFLSGIPPLTLHLEGYVIKPGRISLTIIGATWLPPHQTMNWKSFKTIYQTCLSPNNKNSWNVCRKEHTRIFFCRVHEQNHLLHYHLGCNSWHLNQWKIALGDILYKNSILLSWSLNEISHDLF